LNGKKTDVDNCATNATSRFKAFWACLPVCGSDNPSQNRDKRLTVASSKTSGAQHNQNRGAMLQSAFRHHTLPIELYFKNFSNSWRE